MTLPPLESIPSPPWSFDLAATLGSGQVFHWQSRGAGFAAAAGEVPLYLEQQGHELRCTAGQGILASHYLGLDHDMGKITAAFPSEDAVLQRAMNWCPSLRILRQPRWECLATFITSSLKQVPHIRKISLALRESFGRRIESPGLPVLYSYPSPAVLAAAGEEALRKHGLGYRAAFLHQAAVAVARGKLDLNAVVAMEDADALEALRSLKGVGEKVASCALLFGWERHGAFPIDVWVDRVLRQLYPRCRRMKPPRLRDFARRHFGPMRGYAQQFLFHWARLTDCGAKE